MRCVTLSAFALLATSVINMTLISARESLSADKLMKKGPPLPQPAPFPIFKKRGSQKRKPPLLPAANSSTQIWFTSSSRRHC